MGIYWDRNWQERAETLSREGLYDPLQEHDACGVGLIAAIDGKPRREIVEKAVEALKCVYHRGAVDADGKTGDGAGIHIQIPQEFFLDHAAATGKILAPEAKVAVGMIFLPKKNFAAQESCRAIVEAEILKLGYRLLGWRQVPVVSDVIGEIANESRPEIEQIMIAGKEGQDESRFELELYFIRRRIENAVRSRAIHDFYICSLSCRSVIYKGLFKAEQLTAFYPDLLDRRFISSFAIFHQRFSTNTAPAWHLSQPFRMIAHNGEINTLKGNMNFMRSHEATFSCANYEGFLEDLIPVIPDHTSDTGALDSVVEILTRAGRPLPLSKIILIPPAWHNTSDVPEAHRALFSFCNTVSEPWDGPAAIAGTDGEWVIAGMDRNGLRPMRYAITQDGILCIGSESGMVPVSDAQVVERGRLGPGDILGIHLAQGRLYKDREMKDHLASLAPYSQWVSNIVRLEEVVAGARPAINESEAQAGGTAGLYLPVLRQQEMLVAAGYTSEDIEAILHPMAADGKESVGSMGDDTAMAVLSERFRPFHHFFRQNFSQVTNPPIDPLRERRVMSLLTRFGNDGNYLALDATHSKTLVCETPVLLNHELAAIERHFAKKITKLDTLFSLPAEGGAQNALRAGIERLVTEAEAAVRKGGSFLLLSDENVNESNAAIPMILAVSAVNSHLVRKKLRKKAAILVRTAECMEVHGLSVLIGAGATVVNPYLAEAVIAERWKKGLFNAIPNEMRNPRVVPVLRHDKELPVILANYRDAMSNGLLKVMSKMGISVVSSYRGGLNFEAIGLSRAFVAEFFPGLPSRISGIGMEGIERRVLAQHALAFKRRENEGVVLPQGGYYRYRTRGERHAWDGQIIHLLQSAVATGSYQVYKKFSEAVHTGAPQHLRDLLDFKITREPVAVDQVESITEIRKRFVAPAMSLGALSPEAHETLAIAMNRIGAASNSGEGGEGAERYQPYAGGDNANSTIKQVASARFGVTAEYLNSASELQIKVAQGAKPGEGGQLPGFKVTMEIARLRHATPGVMLISPPPHHDIYSIEDLAQLIYDLKQINPRATVSVKLVAQSGIGTIAAGVAKAMADKIVIAGHSGGTGASPWSSIKHAGIPWEMGLAEANQVLTLNRLRHRVKLQTDGGLKTGRDIVIAAMLGAEEYALGTAALVAMGCLMVRQCHSNTCPVGLTTQDEKLREKFEGTVDKVVNLFSFVAEEVREILAQLGFTQLNDIIGRSDLLAQVSRGAEDLVDLDLNSLLAIADAGQNKRYFSPVAATFQAEADEHGAHRRLHEKPAFWRNEVPDTLDAQMIADAKSAIERGERIQLAYTVKNTMRTIGARLSSEVLRLQSASKGEQAEDNIILRLRGSAGQSLGAFLVRGVRIELYGDANDYVGKGLSGGTIIVRPRPSSVLAPHENTIIGNTVLYGATSGKLFASGQAGERFAVRNSGAITVIEGCGSNACEYMTGGVAVILGGVGHNFAAGMTGGMAFVYDAENVLNERLNSESVIMQPLASSYWSEYLRSLIEEHAAATASPRAQAILEAWDYELPKFRQVCPKEMIGRLKMPLVEEKRAVG